MDHVQILPDIWYEITENMEQESITNERLATTLVQ